MNVLVTGATGFLGSHLAGTLLRAGHGVFALKRPGSNIERLGADARKIAWFGTEPEAMKNAFDTAGTVDAVLHLATTYGRQGEADSAVVKANVLFPLRLLEMAIARQTPLFINADTCFNTGRLQYNYLRSYTLSKRQFMEWGEEIAKAGAIRFINLRLQHPYGPGDSPGKFVPAMIRDCLEKTGEIHLTPGEQKKDFIYVDDVVRAFLTVLQRRDDLPAGFVNLDCGSGKAMSIREFVEKIHRLTKSRATLDFGALPYRDNEIMFSQADITELKKLGWQPQVSVEEGIRTILQRDHGNR